MSEFAETELSLLLTVRISPARTGTSTWCWGLVAYNDGKAKFVPDLFKDCGIPI